MSKEHARLIEVEFNRKEIGDIEELAQAVLDEKHNVVINKKEALTTIAYVYFDTMSKYIAKNRKPTESIEINFADLFKMGIEYNERGKDSEKNGNATGYIEIGKEFTIDSKNDDGEE
jgi:hypothetical protein